MMLMRDKSGRSGRRRGSQKPGTAIGLLMVSVGAVTGVGLCACACAVATIAVDSMAAMMAILPPRAQ